MARAFSINAKDVEDAAAELERQNKPITPHRIKTVLGKGRLSTIAYFLTATKYGGVKHTDDPLTQRLVALMYPLAQELIEESEDKIQSKTHSLSEETKSLKKTISDKDGIITDLQNKLEGECKQITNLTESLKAFSEERQQQHALIDKQTAMISQLENKLEDARKREAVLTSTHDAAMQELNKHQVSSLKQKDEMIALLKQSVSAEANTKESYKSEAKLLTNQLNTHKHNLAMLNEKLLTQQESLTNAQVNLNQLESDKASLHNELALLSSTIENEKEQRQLEQAADQQLITQLQQDIQAYKTQKEELSSVKAELEKTKTKLAYSESLFKQLGNQA